MGVIDRWDQLPLSSRRADGKRRRLLEGCVAFAATVILAGIGFLLHLNLSTAGSLELLAVVLVALRWGFVQATMVSVAGVLCLDYFFTQPIFQLSVADIQNWVSLGTFEITALLVSGLSSKVRMHAAEAEEQRRRSLKLYQLSRAILLIDARSFVTTQLATLIRELVGVEEAIFWVLEEASGRHAEPSTKDLAAYKIFQAGVDSDEPDDHVANRMLRSGATSIGAIILRGGDSDPLLADAVASLAAIAIQRAHALQRENQAEAERNTEQLRTAVLDGLAHEFKTPLTAIQTASSGLLAIDGLSPPQLELVSIIDERTNMLSRLCTRLLQTAALESREVRLRRSLTDIADLLHEIVSERDESTRARIVVRIPEPVVPIDVDAPMVQSAVLQLVDNAAKYADVESPILLTLRQFAEETMIIVENSGSPIPASDKEKIFQRFYRGAHAAHGPTGTGLGLSIVKKTAEAHGGSVSVESSDGKTRFRLTLQHARKVR